MRNNPIRRKFWQLAVAEIVLAVCISAAWFYFRTAPMLAMPPPENGDLYAYNWGFQSIVFVVFWLPPTLLAVGVLLGIQRLVLKSRCSSGQAQCGDSAA